jgi:hypothetical protein
LIYLASYVTAPSVLPLEVVPPILVPVDSLTISSSDSGALELEVSEALGISLSEVHDLYFGGIDKVRRDRIIGEAMDCRWEDLQEREQFDENHRRECEEEIRSYREDSMF